GHGRAAGPGVGQAGIASAGVGIATVDDQRAWRSLLHVLLRQAYRRGGKGIAGEYARYTRCGRQVEYRNIISLRRSDRSAQRCPASSGNIMRGFGARQVYRHQSRPYQCVCFLPEPQGHCSLRPILRCARGNVSGLAGGPSASAASACPPPPPAATADAEASPPSPAAMATAWSAALAASSCW